VILSHEKQPIAGAVGSPRPDAQAVVAPFLTGPGLAGAGEAGEGGTPEVAQRWPHMRPATASEYAMATPEKYVDSFVMPVAKAHIDDYKKFAEAMAAIARKHGAIEYVNCLADDVKPGKETSFPQAVKLRSNEVVVSS